MTDVPKDIMEAAETIVDSLNRFEPICSCSEPDMQMSEFGDYLNRDDVIAALSALLAERERRTFSPGWPDPLESPQADAIRSGKIDDVEIRNLFDQMEREIQVHRKAFCERRTPDVVAWQPIETAPKDGTSILVAHELAVFSACWEKDGRETNTGQPGWIDGVMNRSEEYVVYEPTHWMPLPDLPAAPSLSSGAGRSEERG